MRATDEVDGEHEQESHREQLAGGLRLAGTSHRMRVPSNDATVAA